MICKTVSKDNNIMELVVEQAWKGKNMELISKKVWKNNEIMKLPVKQVWNIFCCMVVCVITVIVVFLNGEAVFAASTGHKTCSHCNGVGKIVCTSCNGEGRIVKETYVGEGWVSINGGSVVYDFRSYIRYKPCIDCGGSNDNDEWYSLYTVYYSDSNFKTIIYESGTPIYVVGTGYRGACTVCKGNGEVAITYEVKYHGNGNTGGSMSNSIHTYNTSQNLNKNQFKRDGYTFLGWSTTNGIITDTGNDVTISYKDGVSVKNLASQQGKTINLYAIWQRNKYMVTYDANGGIFEGTSTTQSVYYGNSVNISPSCTKDGYIFLGWATGIDEDICVSSYAMPAKNITLYALYSIPVSDIKEAHVVSYNTQNPNKYNLFELKKQSETINGYIYDLDGMNLLNGLSQSNLEVWLLLYDNAGNRSQIPIETPISVNQQEPEDIPVPNIYLQTVEHYLWNMQTESYQYYMSKSELIYEGETYTPAYIATDSEDYPIGYKTEKIDNAYMVDGAKTTKAYYKPIAYTLYFDANGGTCEVESKEVYTGSMYGELPTPSKKGHDFMGWHTDKKNGTKVTATDIYEDTGDNTLYAIWEAHTHNIVYDYRTNGGTYVEKENQSAKYGETIDLTVKAYKDNWEFVGWNTNPDATEGLKSLTMGEDDILLYAIYKKEITATFIDMKDEQQTSRKINTMIYNRQTQGIISVPKQNMINGWTCLGWSFDTEANAPIEMSAGSMLKLAQDTILYGCYSQKITISYDTNGSSEEISPQIGERYWNAFGKKQNPKFMIAKAPNLQKHSFVLWEEYAQDGTVATTYHAQEWIEGKKDIRLVAKWDCWPQIEAYDRYFTIEDAVSGKITSQELLKKVVATDKEDGILNNGNEVRVTNYNAEEFLNITEDTELKVTYVATDSFGNRVNKTITIYVVDTTVTVSPIANYIRFISKDFYLDGVELLSAEKGGVEENSVWRNNEHYQTLLKKTLLNRKYNEKVKTMKFFDVSAEIADVASGNWEYEQETWTFTYEDIQKIDTFTDTYGFGNIKIKNGLELFEKQFGNCRQ